MLVMNIKAATIATKIAPIIVHTSKAEIIATSASSTSMKKRTLPGTATTIWRLSPTVENTLGSARRTAKTGIVTNQVPEISAAAHGPAIQAIISIANLDDADKIVSSGLSKFFETSSLLMEMKLSGVCCWVQEIQERLDASSYTVLNLRPMVRNMNPMVPRTLTMSQWITRPMVRLTPTATVSTVAIAIAEKIRAAIQVRSRPV